MFINVKLLRTDLSVSVTVGLHENVLHDLVVERLVTRVPGFLKVVLQILFHLKNGKTTALFLMIHELKLSPLGHGCQVWLDKCKRW